MAFFGYCALSSQHRLLQTYKQQQLLALLSGVSPPSRVCLVLGDISFRCRARDLRPETMRFVVITRAFGSVALPLGVSFV